MPSLTPLWPRIKRLITRWRRRIWWFDVLYPVALGTILFGFLSYAVYAGQRQWQLSLQAEKRLLDFSLRQASRLAALRQAGEDPANNGQGRSRIMVVSALPGDLAPPSVSTPGATPDATVATYAGVIKRLADGGVPVIFVRWDLRNHQGDEAGYFMLGRVLLEAKSTTKVYFVLPPTQGERLPSSLQGGAERLDDAACAEASVVQTACSYLPTYREWVVQRILESFSKEGQDQPPAWVSDQLPNVFPSYILRLAPVDDGSRHSFSEVLAAPESLPLKGWQAAFIGVGRSPAPVVVVGQPDLAATIFDRFAPSGPVTGTPLHEFWAMLAQMFAEGGEVSVPPAAVVAGVTVVFCLFLVGTTVLFDVFVGLAVFIAVGLLAPLANAAALHWGRFYLPLFDSYYFGLALLFVAGLVHLSLLSIQRWRLEALRRLHTRSADLKGNFISLLTHNLNTPVAKMQGMLGLLAMQAKGAPWLQETLQAEAFVTQLEIAIRSVLIAAALEEGVVHPAARHAQALLDELLTSSVASLRRLGVQLTAAGVSSSEEGEEYLPLLLDQRAVMAAISAVAALFHAPPAQVPLVLQLHVATTSEGVATLTATLTSASHWISPEAAAILITQAPLHVRSLSEGLFFPSVLAGLAQVTTAAFHGRVHLQPGKTGGGDVVLVFQALASG